MSQVQPQFDPNDPKYICCCGCHVTVGAKILASLQTASIILIAISVISMIEQVKRQSHFTSVLVTFICIFLIIISINGSLWYGLITEREGFLIPTLICMVGVLRLFFCCLLYQRNMCEYSQKS
uniref:Transmembrane protein n=1 Tax=Plectus sambesii TaxID=2011161 RepID=A0A914XC47_9BILA